MKYKSPSNTKHKPITAPPANKIVRLSAADIAPYVPLFGGDEHLAVQQAAYDKEWRRIARDHDILPGDDVQDEIIWQEHIRHVLGVPGVKDPIDYDLRAKKEFTQAAMEIHKNGVMIIEEEAPPMPSPEMLASGMAGMGMPAQFTAPSTPPTQAALGQAPPMTNPAMPSAMQQGV